MHLFGIRSYAEPPLPSSDFTISSNVTNWNLSDMLGYTPSTPIAITITVNTNRVVRGVGGTVAMDLDADLPSGSEVSVVNNGYIHGDGGDGGSGAGDDGGDAIKGPGAGITFSITNAAGHIFGGGGGGGIGGFGSAVVHIGPETDIVTGGGGGGGGGAGGSLGGAGSLSEGHGAVPSEDGADGTSGVSGAPGAGGDGGSVPGECTGGDGGDGGDWGQDGEMGHPGSDANAGEAGGDAGKAVELNGGSVSFVSGNVAARVKGGSVMTPEELQESRTPGTLDIAPGFFSENTDRAVMKRWKHGNRVRFRNGLPQKIGGWISTTITGATHYGVPRSTWEWVSHDGEKWIAEGTSEKLYLISRNVRYDITPVRATGTLANDPFAVVDTSATVTVTHTAHGASVGDFVRFSGATAGGGITIDGEYKIVSVVDSGSYTITHSAVATSTDATTGGAAVTFSYDIAIGAASNQAATGFGTGPFGGGLFGTPRVVAATSLFTTLRVWSLDNFGEDLIASPTNGAIYHWDKTNGTSVRAVLLSDAPATNKHVLISQSGGRIVCLGAYDPVAGADDPLNIIAGAEESFTEFEVVDETSDVFTDRVKSGSTLVGGLRTSGGLLIWTDGPVYMMIPDPVQIYRLHLISDENAFIGPNAAVDVNGTVYGMAFDKFMAFDGVYQELPCEVWGYLFDNDDTETPGFNKEQAEKVIAWHNKKFSEVWWFYPARDEDENSRAVIFNHAERIWYYLEISRTAALKKGASYGVPIAFNESGTLFQHETGRSDNGAAMNEFLESYDMELGSGETTHAISRIIPDIKRQIGTMLLTLNAKVWPEDVSYVSKGPYSIVPGTKKLDPRCKGRQISMRLETTEVESNWRLGPFKIYTQPDAERA